MAFIQFEHVDLQYPLRGPRITLKEYVVQGLFRSGKRVAKPMIHALRDMSFQIGDGERVGIIGRNGAGKSTLLRTIGGIYPVARGRRIVQGSVCALFDIALGFEPEATGRQNVYYRSYLQGETPETIEAKLPDIAEFCELGDFLDLPLRCYSHGMIMRLAFAIATSSAPEILLIDEVLAVGDEQFQRKSFFRMRKLIESGSLVVIVSHNTTMLEQLCNRVILIEGGRIVADGEAPRIIGHYRRSLH